jgi:hypothetical protein
MLMVVVSGLLELHVLSQKAKDVQLLVRTAGDMALDQSQVLDDFMSYDGRESYKLKMPSADGGGFVSYDLFGGVYGLDSTVETNKEPIFLKLYDNNDFKMLASRTNAMRRPVKYWNASKTGFEWYYIPRITMMGLDILPSGQSVRGVKDASGQFVSEAFAAEILSAYDLDSHTKYSGGKEYFNTPLNIGVTYLNEELLSTLFVNNMDLMMRLKYDKNLNSEDGGDGILKGTTYSDKVKGTLSTQNPINNGNFSILRGTQNASSPTVKSFSGVKPLIVYKVIDMYDSDNDDMLVSLFGANKSDAETGNTYTSKAEYLKAIDEDVKNPVNGMPYSTKPIIVAKVTFYADVVIPYFSLIAREMRANLGDGTNNFVELLPEKTDGAEGTRRLAYTRYFAVTP